MNPLVHNMLQKDTPELNGFRQDLLRGSVWGARKERVHKWSIGKDNIHVIQHRHKEDVGIYIWYSTEVEVMRVEYRTYDKVQRTWHGSMLKCPYFWARKCLVEHGLIRYHDLYM